MKEWFKARLNWKGAFDALSDAEAGRLAKALWFYASTGKQADLSGKETGAYGIFLETLRGDAEEGAYLSSVRSEAGRKGGLGRRNKANEAIASKSKQNEANEAIAYNKNKNKNNYPPVVPLISDEEVFRIQEDHNEIFEKLKYAGFDLTQALMDKVVNLYAEFGKEIVLDSIEGCINASKPRLDYLLGCIRNHGKSKADESKQDDKQYLSDEESKEIWESIIWE